jgi:preprotein translocase subunit SecB
MKLAPLQLTDYFVLSIHVEALADYDAEKEQDLDVANLLVTESCVPAGEDKPNRFLIDLVIKQEALEGKNLPYSYELHMIGFIEVSPNFPEDRVQRAVETNGPSMLFGAAREILRAATGRGPYGPVLIPSTTFFKQTEVPASEETTQPATKASRKRSSAKEAKKTNI